MTLPRVAITGIGILSPFGRGKAAALDALRNARLFHRFFRGGERETGEAIELAWFEDALRHLAADADVQTSGVDGLDFTDAAAGVAQRVERRGLAAAEGGDDADAGDGYTHTRECRMQNDECRHNSVLHSAFIILHSGAKRRHRPCRRTS